MKKIKLNKKKILLTILFVFVLGFLNNLIFSSQLAYGFRDVDWHMLYSFKLFGKLSLDHLLETYRRMGVYTYELYYVGFLVSFLGLDFEKLHLASQIFKVITALGLYLVVLKVFKRKLLAFCTSIIYTISYTHAGPLFQLSTGGYFLATIFMCIFFLSYYYSNLEHKFFNYFLTSVLLVVTLILAPERMYPLLPLILLIEVFIFFKNGRKKENISNIFKRLFVIFFPIILFVFIYIANSKASINNTGFAPGQFFIGILDRAQTISSGNWQQFLYPFASLGSIFLHGAYWKIMGQVNVSSFEGYLLFLILGPLLKLGILGFIIFSVISKKPLRQTIILMTSIFIFGLFSFFIYSNWFNLNDQLRVHFDPNLVFAPAFFGFFIISLTTMTVFQWLKNRDGRLMPLIVGTSFSFLVIILTWVASDLQLVFLGTQRYLSIPSMGVSLFISGILILFYDNIKKSKLRRFAWIVFIFLVPLFYINYNVARIFFDYELNYAGLRATDQTRMKSAFAELTPNINNTERSLFYFDETADHENGYFDESTIMAGFEYWTRVDMNGDIKYFPEPGMLRTNVQCSEHTHASCIKMLKEGLIFKDGENGVLYKDLIRGQKEPRFYKLSNFYAFRFINKQLTDITGEVLKEINQK